MKRFNFNMVEIMLAVTVTALGITCIMGLFPMTLRAVKDTVSENYIPSSASQILGYWELVAANPSSWEGSTAFNSLKEGNRPGFSDEENVSWDSDDIKGFDGLYGSNNSKLYKIDVKPNKDSDISEFKGIVRVWADQIKYTSPVTGSEQTIPDSIGRRIFVEIAFPYDEDDSETEYDNRSKRIYLVDVYKRQNN